MKTDHLNLHLNDKKGITSPRDGVIPFFVLQIVICKTPTILTSKFLILHSAIRRGNGGQGSGRPTAGYRSSRKYASPRPAGGCFSLLLRRLEMISTITVTT